MGLFGGIDVMQQSDLTAAVDRIANYYRQSKLYLSLCNSTDAYDYIVNRYTADYAVMLESQYCYKYRGNYLFATDLVSFCEEEPEVAERFYDSIPGMLQYAKRERKPVMFINSIGPAKDVMDEDTYRLINDFVSMFSNTYVILSDCTSNVDQEIGLFEAKTRCRQMNINGNVFYRWG